MVSKWTKGPWRAEGGRIYEGSSKKVIAEVNIAWRSTDEMEANARLIAEAPNITEALRVFYSQFALEENLAPEQRAAIKQARTALAKTTQVD